MNNSINYEKINIQFPNNDFKLLSRFITGSRLYGTFNENSDWDIRGLFLPSKDYILGFLKNCDILNKKDDLYDVELMGLKRFFFLCADNNPNIIEYLFIPEDKYLNISDIWRKVIENRELFLSKKTKYTFLGYAISQLKRIQTHRRWLLNPPNKKPERKDFKLKEERSELSSTEIGAFNRIFAEYLEQLGNHHELKEELNLRNEKMDYISLVAQIQKLRKEDIQIIMPELPESFLTILQREKEYRRQLHEWTQYQNWKKNRNPERAAMEAKWGFDSKHGSHIFRLMSEGEEILINKTLTFPRPDKEFLIEIKNGKYSYDEIMDKIKDVEEHFQKLYDQSTLPKQPNRVKLDELFVEIIEENLK